MNFPSVSLFSSTANADLTKFFKRLGCEASTNAYSITGSTPFVDSLLSVKYALYSEAVSGTDLVRNVAESGGTYLCENRYTLPLGFVISPDVEDNWQYAMDNPAEVQNDLCLILGSDDVLVSVDSESSGSTCRFTADMTGEYYVFVQNKRVKEVKAELPTGQKTFNNTDRGYLLELGTIGVGNQVVLTAEESGEVLNALVYRFSERALISVYETLNQMPMHLTSWTDTELSGTVEAEEAGLLFTSIPYDEGWTVSIDGQKVKPRKVFEALLAVDIPAGSHQVLLTYFPGGLAHGIMISAAALFILLILFIINIYASGSRRTAAHESPADASEISESQPPARQQTFRGNQEAENHESLMTVNITEEEEK